MKTADFDYILPPDLIAQKPANPRDHSRLMVVDRRVGVISHHQFFEIGQFLRPGDLLIVNESKVFKARLMGSIRTNQSTPIPVEIFLLRPEGSHWLAMANPGKKLHPDTIVTFNDNATCRVINKHIDGTIEIDFDKTPDEVFAWADQVGQVPTPPYVKPSELKNSFETTYQTVYAKTVGSVAAPTAGFHFTPELIERLKTQGIQFATVTLHVGIGTFRPMKTDTLEEHVMHEEWIDVPDKTLEIIQQTRNQGGRVIAVGTTTVRALESNIRHGFTNIFITPGYTFRFIDGFITNFHLPKSTLLVLVSAFMGKKLMFNAYAEAIQAKYRFYSFGDAMLIV